MAQDTILRPVGDNDRGANNLATFKGFTWGLGTLSVPKSWVPSKYQLNLVQGRSSIQFRFYEINTHNDRAAGYYAVTGTITTGGKTPLEVCAILGGKCATTVSAFWEVVSSDRYQSLTQVQDVVTARNKASNFDDKALSYFYNSTTGEVLELYKDAGQRNPGGIAAFILPSGLKQDIKYFQIDASDRGKNMPLIEVFELDKNSLFTGQRYVFSYGDGIIQIWNPWGTQPSTWCIDSYDYRNPQASERCSGV
jgi:hypothetical protein